MDLSLYVFYMRKRFMGQTGSDIVHEIEMPDYRPATTEEIMDAHPKCGECICFNPHNSHCTCIDYPTFGETVDPTTYYCRHWEAKQ